jgi:hypothetical protein
MDKENQEEKITTTNVDPVAEEGRRGDEGRILAFRKHMPSPSSGPAGSLLAFMERIVRTFQSVTRFQDHESLRNAG